MSQFLINQFPTTKTTVINRAPITWLAHAEKHFKQASIYIKNRGESGESGDYVIVDSCEEQLMYLCLFSNVGMFDCTHPTTN